MVLVDGRRRLVEVNAAYLRLLGYERRAIIGRPIYRHIAGGALISPRVWKSALSSGRLSGEGHLLRADGSQVDVQWAATNEIVTGRRLTLVVALTVAHAEPNRTRTDAVLGEPETLSPREREVIQRVALGASGAEIADQLQVTEGTVQTHVRSAMAKTGSQSRALLIVTSLGAGLVFGRPGQITRCG
jgi:PAS domain S-box-containing protein